MPQDAQSSEPGQGLCIQYLVIVSEKTLAEKLLLVCPLLLHHVSLSPFEGRIDEHGFQR